MKDEKPTYQQLEEQNAQLRLKLKEQRQRNISPLDYKYDKDELSDYISGAAIWKGCAFLQLALMRGQEHFGKATEENVLQMEDAFRQFCSADADYFESVLRHDQRAVIRVLSKYVSAETAQKMHPGTTSYDILDTTRNRQFKKIALELVVPQAKRLLKVLVGLAEEYKSTVQVGRTHGQWTSPITFGYSIATYADRLAGRIDKIEETANNLEGKISGIVGTHASIVAVLGRDIAKEFEKYVVEELLDLKVCPHSTQIVSKEGLCDYAHAFVTLHGVLADMANEMRDLQRSEIAEVSSRMTQKDLGGSSTDPSKDNPIHFENTEGGSIVTMSGMNIVYHLQVSDHQRDLTGSVQARFEPQQIIAMSYEAIERMKKTMGSLAVNEASMERNLTGASRMPAEAMNNILKAHGIDSYNMVKEFSITAKRGGLPLLNVAMEDKSFQEIWNTILTDEEKNQIEDIRLFTGLAVENTEAIITRLKEKYNFE